MKSREDLDVALVMCPGWGVEYPPVGISYLSGFLKRKGINAKCFDFNIEFYKLCREKEYWNLNSPEYFIVPDLFKKNIFPKVEPFIEKWAVQILADNPKIVGFSLFMPTVNISLLLAAQLKKLKKELIVIGGGPEVTRIKRVVYDKIRRFAFINEEVLTGFDILVDGEGEDSLWEVVHSLRCKSGYGKIAGIIFKADDISIVNKPRSLMAGLDDLPAGDFDDYCLKDYTRSVLPIVTSRGCVNRCTFCADSPLWKSYRSRSPEKVVAEIMHLSGRYKRKGFEICDSTLNGDTGRVEKICDLIIKLKLKIKWSGKATLNKRMNYDLLCKMKEAGCVSLGYGVESASAAVLRDMCKNIDITEAARIIRDTYRAGIEANCFFLIGYPSETEADFRLTLDFIKDNAAFINCFDQITGCHLEEDSYLGRNIGKYGIVFKEDGWHSRESTPEIRRERLQRFKELAGKLHEHYKCEVQL